MKFLNQLLVTAAACVSLIACDEYQHGKQRPGLTEAEKKVATEDSSVTSVTNTEAPSDNEGYDHIVENNFLSALESPLSTFSIDVDRASYSNVRRFILDGSLPPPGAVRIEEMINYFDYNYPQPSGEDPFSITTELNACPWNPQHQLVLIGLQGKRISTENLPASNLVFLVDVSGSMDEPNKLPLVKESMHLLIDQLRETDRVAIVVYAGQAGLALPSTAASDKKSIHRAIERLEAGGSTAGGEGIQLAYSIARENFLANGNNRVILATDGDFNVGASSEDALVRLIEEERSSGIYLSVLGFGTGNYQDAKMQQLADKGNGNHSYIDNIAEAKKILGKEFGGTLFTIAKDVKIQVEFNPEHVKAYRLIGYENRVLTSGDFNDDTKDAGEIGSGHAVTALYEIIPQGVEDKFSPKVDALKYQHTAVSKESLPGEIMTIKFRYKKPGEMESRLITSTMMKTNAHNPSANFNFAASVAEFGMLLRSSAYKQQSSIENVMQLAQSAKGDIAGTDRDEFMFLVQKAKRFQLQ